MMLAPFTRSQFGRETPMSSSAYSRVSAVVFALVAVLHAWRAAQSLPLQIGATDVPVWGSWVVTAVAALLSVWGFRQRP
jgi:hypothetical protein